MKEWDFFLDEHQKTVGADAIEKWARTLKVLHFDAGNLYLEASDPFQLNWFEEYLRPLIKKSFYTASGRAIKVHLTLAGRILKTPHKEWKPPLDLTPDSLLSTCTFETYFPGDTNDFNLKLFQETLLHKTYNPIYIQGPDGIGKTHLLMAACQLLKKQNRTVFFIKADRFTQHIIAAIRSGSMPLFRDLYRKHDALVIDEIETLADRTASQEELFHTFNALHLRGKQIILASSSLPLELKDIEPRLTSRFGWGLVLSFQPLTELERKKYFLQLLARKKVPDHFVSECVTLLPTIPLLNRAADILEVRTREMAATPELLQKWLSPLIQEQRKKALNSDTILQAVARHFDIHLNDLQGRSQTQEHTLPRQIAMYLCRNTLKLPYMKIAAIFSRDHSTVMSSVKIITKRVQDDASIQENLKTIMTSLK